MRPLPSAAAVAAFAMLQCGASSLTLADGAIAAGVTPDKAQVVFGQVINSRSEVTARQAALDQCRRPNPTAPLAGANCRVLQTFKNECYAIAMDPAGPPGWGWAVARTKAGAEVKAVAECRAAAGPDRRAGCAPSASACDGTAR